MQPRRGPSEVQLLGDGDEVAQLAQLMTSDDRRSLLAAWTEVVDAARAPDPLLAFSARNPGSQGGEPP